MKYLRHLGGIRQGIYQTPDVRSIPRRIACSVTLYLRQRYATHPGPMIGDTVTVNMRPFGLETEDSVTNNCHGSAPQNPPLFDTLGYPGNPIGGESLFSTTPSPCYGLSQSRASYGGGFAHANC